MSRPFLSICIPTFNRAKLLDENLKIIYEQIGDDPTFEVLVINNNSTDETEQVIQKYANQFKNFVHDKNAVNIGADHNIFKVFEQAKGQYGIWHGDDDYFLPGTLQEIVSILKQYPQCGVFFINPTSRVTILKEGTGLTQFLTLASINSTAITSIILAKDLFNQLDTPGKYIETALNQVYLIYRILLICPKFLIINKYTFKYQAADADGYNFGNIFVKNYLELLYSFIPQGLDAHAVANEKYKLLIKFIIPWYKILQTKGRNIDISDTAHYVEEYYKNESYYQDYRNIFSSDSTDK